MIGYSSIWKESLGHLSLDTQNDRSQVTPTRPLGLTSARFHTLLLLQWAAPGASAVGNGNNPKG